MEKFFVAVNVRRRRGKAVACATCHLISDLISLKKLSLDKFSRSQNFCLKNFYGVIDLRIRVFQTGKVYVSHALPFKDKMKNPNPLQLSLLSLYGRRNRIWLPVSAYLVEHSDYKILIDTGWHCDISPNGEYNRRAQVKHMGLGHFLLNQRILPEGKSIVEQLSEMNIAPADLDFVIMTHLHTDHASGLKSVTAAKKILVSAAEVQDTKNYPIRYASSMWNGVDFETFHFKNTGVGPVGKSLDLLGDGSIELVNIPGHTSGLTAVKLNSNGKFVLLFSDGGYATKSWQNLIPPGTALDEELAFKSLLWIREMSLQENCLESLANHDADVIPHEINF